MVIRKKLIEVSIPLEAINAASAKEKSIRHGHPSTLHLWWARRPLAACRAVLFAQLVDDPSSWPDRFPTPDAVEAERKYLHAVIERMVPWEASGDERVLTEARWCIARSVAWGLGEEPPEKDDARAVLAYLQEKAPPVYDPFSGGGSIPLEAQRLGLRAYGSDLNPVAVLIGKALVEIPPKFAGLPPVNPEARARLAQPGAAWNGRGAEGLAEDVRWYGRWMRDEAERRIGHLYPKARLPDGGEATVIAWLWARTVRSPDPAAKGAHVPLVSSFMLSTKDNRKAWVEPVLDPDAPDGYRFEVRTGALEAGEEERLKKGTKSSRGANFTCILTGTVIGSAHVKAEGCAGRIKARLMAIVTEEGDQRYYLNSTVEHEKIAESAAPSWIPEQDMPRNPRWFSPPDYGMTTYASIFTSRQLVALSIFSDLVVELFQQICDDVARTTPVEIDVGDAGNYSGYANAVTTYLSLIVSKLADRSSSVCSWDLRDGQGRKPGIRNVFSRQAIAMSWDFAETNVFSEIAASISTSIWRISDCLLRVPAIGTSRIGNAAAQRNHYAVTPTVISTDPPYYDNIGYADLSDFFYVWLSKCLQGVYPDLFRRITTPKEDELVAIPIRRGGKSSAEAFFMDGMSQALRAMRNATLEQLPLAIYYAFKQSEAAKEGVTSAGWASFLQAVIDSDLLVDGTWPLRTELGNRMVSMGTNALASSIVLVCRKRPEDAATATRAEFLRALKRELPEALARIREAGIRAVDFQQAAIGPGMGVFSRYARVLEPDDTPMPVRTALALINNLIEELEDDPTQYDPATQVAIAWFRDFGWGEAPSGTLITLANAKATALDALERTGVFVTGMGKARLVRRHELAKDWNPATDRAFAVWEGAQHLARKLEAEDGGLDAAARLLAGMGSTAAGDVLALVFRLFQIAERDRKDATEALVWNRLSTDWPTLESRAGELVDTVRVRGDGPAQGVLSLN